MAANDCDRELLYRRMQLNLARKQELKRLPLNARDAPLTAGAEKLASGTFIARTQ